MPTTAELLASAELLFAEANVLEGLIDELSSATARLTDVWVGPSQERVQHELLSERDRARVAIEQIRAEAASLAEQATLLGSPADG